MRIAGLILALALVSCSSGRDVPTKQPATKSNASSPRESEISPPERQAIKKQIESQGFKGAIGEIKRKSVDTFHVDVEGVSCIISLREDGIWTEGDLSPSEIDFIKRTANDRRRWTQFNISSIRQTGPNKVTVMTGDFGTASGELFVFERSNNTWQMKSASHWVE